MFAVGSISIVIALAIFARMKKYGWNSTLAAILGSVIFFSAGVIVYFVMLQRDKIIALAGLAVAWASLVLSYWFITELYLRVAHVSKKDKNEKDNEETDKQDDPFYRKLTIARILIIVISLTVGVLSYVGFDDSGPKEATRTPGFVAAYIAEVTIFVCLLVWGWTLRTIYKDIAKSEDVLPNKCYFVLLATFIVLMLLLYIGSTVLVEYSETKERGSEKYFYSVGCVHLAGILTHTIHLATCFIVAFQAQPCSETQRKKFISKYLNGYESVKDFEDSIRREHPHKTNEEIESMVSSAESKMRQAENMIMTSLGSVVTYRYPTRTSAYDDDSFDESFYGDESG